MVKNYSRRAFQIDREFDRMNSEIDIMFVATEEKLTSLRDYIFMGNCIRALYDGMERLFEIILSSQNKSATNVVRYHADVLASVSQILEFDEETRKEIASWQGLSHFFHHGYSHQVKPENIVNAIIELPELFVRSAHGVLEFWHKYGIQIETTEHTIEDSVKKLFQMKKEFQLVLDDMSIKNDETANVANYPCERK